MDIHRANECWISCLKQIPQALAQNLIGWPIIWFLNRHVLQPILPSPPCPSPPLLQSVPRPSPVRPSVRPSVRSSVRYFVTYPLPALGCYWLYRKWPANKSGCTVRSLLRMRCSPTLWRWVAVNWKEKQFLMNTLYENYYYSIQKMLL